MHNFLSIPEELVLLTIEENGGIVPHSKNLESVLAASVLMDLALRNRIDSDTENLIRVSNNPTGDVVLDDALSMIFQETGNHDPSYWISQLALRSYEFSEQILAGLVLKKVLKVENQRMLWFLSKRKYPIVNNTEIKEVKERIRELVFGNDLPDARDIVIVSLLYHGDMMDLVFTHEEAGRYLKRISTLAMMDLIGQGIVKALDQYSESAFTTFTRNLLGLKTPEEKLEALVEEMKEKYRIRNDADLPDWLRKGTTQYLRTLDYIRETGNGEVYYNRQQDKYFPRQYFYYGHIFGSGQ